MCGAGETFLAWFVDRAAPAALVETVDCYRVLRGEVGEEVVVCIALMEMSTDT